MMKKILSLALSLMLVLCAVSALAETAEATVLVANETFIIQANLPEGITIKPISGEENGTAAVFEMAAGEDKPVIYASVAYNEEYAEVERLNDVDEETMQEIRDSFLDAFPDAVFEDLESAYGTRLLKVTSASAGVVDIYTNYKSYELEFLMTPAKGKELTEDDVKILVQFISDIEFVPAA